MGDPTHRGTIAPGTEIDGFVIEAVAGRGGMGVVYRARQKQPDRVVALKVIGAALAEDDVFRTRFARESSIAAQIEHPNVIPVYAVGEADGVLYLVMRFVEGTDLRQLLAQEGRLQPARAVAIVDAVGQALDAAHAHGLVHRDVKPANILISTAGGREHVYLSDFGLSRHIEGSGGLTGTGAFLGTIDYVAPEQARGERVDARTDVYSLGCVLFQALTGTVPFPLDNDLAKLYAHDRQAPPSPLERTGDLPPAFEPMLARAMAKSPDDRYLSAGDLGRAALAAASGDTLSRAERSVAVEGAAPSDAHPVPAGGGSTATPGGGAPPPTVPGTAEGTSVPTVAPARTSRRRASIIGGLALGAAAVAAVVIAVAGGGAKDEPGPGSAATTTAAPPASAPPAAAPNGKFSTPSFESSAGVRCQYQAPTLTCRNVSGETATLTKSGKAKLGHSDTALPGGTLLQGKGFWEGGEMQCFPKPNGAVSCAAFNGHGFNMEKDEQGGTSPY